ASARLVECTVHADHSEHTEACDVTCTSIRNGVAAVNGINVIRGTSPLDSGRQRHGRRRSRQRVAKPASRDADDGFAVTAWTRSVDRAARARILTRRFDSRGLPMGVGFVMLPRAPSGLRGFSLLELMVALTVLGILLGVGVPSFATLTQNNRVTTQTNELVSALNLARSEAIRRGAPTTVEAVLPASGFAAGWCIYVGTGGCGDPSGVLRVYPPMTRMSVEADATSIVFDARGARRQPTDASLTVTL